LVALPMGVLRAALFGTGNVRTPAIIYFIEAIANLILSILFCQQFGTIGVAYGTLLPILICEVGWLLPDRALLHASLRTRSALDELAGAAAHQRRRSRNPRNCLDRSRTADP
jgi:peptidoglycan biosynthesis protein MviN/MurJ (putative lipid II flippase)